MEVTSPKTEKEEDKDDRVEERTELLLLGNKPIVIGGPPSQTNLGQEDEDVYYYGWSDKIRPTCLQCMVDKKAFLIVFCMTCVLQGTFHTYFVAVITTLEKLFNIPSRTIGGLMTATEIGQVTSSLFLPYFLSQSHRPRWIGLGSALFAISTLFCASPHFLLPSEEHNYSNVTSYCTTSDEESLLQDDCTTRETGTHKYLFGIIFLSLLSIGFGQTAIFTLGIPYMDDNVASRDSPLYFSITIGVRILGPVMGFILGGLCTRLYINPLDPPEGLDPSDPRWLGAWWLGLLIISFVLFVVSCIMYAFPRRLPTNNNALHLSQQPQKTNTVQNFFPSLKRLATNRILILRTFSSVFHLLPISGLYIFLPKYLESQFRLAAFEANLVTGIAGILVMGVGIFASGWWIRKREPSPTKVAWWVAIAAVIYASGIFLLAFVGCGSENDVVTGSLTVPACVNEQCTSCPEVYAPVCGEDNKSYLSPCHAGCTGNYGDQFLNCTCVQNTPDSRAIPGLCSLDCPLFPLYLAIFVFAVLVHSTSEVGSMMLTLRCVENSDKSMALGLVQAAIGIFGNVPCPLIYSYVVDQACMVWGSGSKECDGDTGGGHGNCWVYDGAKFKLYFHGLTASLMTVAFIIDLIIVYNAKKISFNLSK